MNDELTRDIYQRLGGIEAKLDDVRSIRDKADEAQLTAKSALGKAHENARNIDKLAATTKWALGIVAGFLTPLVFFVLSQILGG